MSSFWSLILILGFCTQAASQPPQLLDGLTPAEKSQLAKEEKIDRRIKIYQTASERFQATLERAINKHDYQPILETMQSWLQLLEASLKDIDASITNRKKKSKALIRYEIQLRKATSRVQGYKTAVPVDVFDVFETWLKHAEEVHQEFVDILFPK